MPEMNIKAPKISMPDFDLHLKGPKVKGDVDVSLPKVEGDLKGPEVDIKGPKCGCGCPRCGVHGPDWHLKMPKIKMPNQHAFLQRRSPDGCETARHLDVSGPKVDIDTPDIDIHGPEGS
ncbi:Neuroblast differentiation-associated protein AHNAK [Camelus dromedarius]|uniref:Neuroblast differentiation-associated protein AHNAK n=1 Tax=Camelus dromedarius TaxID=9838 RepID=A0A5N4DNY8_CAMDR|nr:Neuroblast differentiation-associated protein AHNAK [Camelus dromedarius]